MMKIILMIGALLMLLSSNAAAQEKVVGGKCRADLQRLCQIFSRETIGSGPV